MTARFSMTVHAPGKECLGAGDTARVWALDQGIRAPGDAVVNIEAVR